RITMLTTARWFFRNLRNEARNGLNPTGTSSSCGSGMPPGGRSARSLIADLRVQDSADDIRRQIGGDGDGAVEDCDTHHPRIVGAYRPIDEITADPGDLEYLLDDDRAGHRDRGRGAKIGYDRHDGALHRVF